MSGHAATTTAPPAVKFVLLQFPAPHVLLVTINFEKQMNSLPVDAVWEMHRVWKWFDDEPELERVSRLIGMPARVTERQSLSKSDFDSAARLNAYPSTGFAGLTRRNGRKPIIAACNGHAHGGGFEIVLNSDIVIASENADFRLPDVLRGTAAMAGAFPRLCRTFGLQRAMWLGLTAHTLTAQEALQWGLVQKIVPIDDLIKEAVDVAKLIASMSPDSVIVTRAGIRQAWETSSIEHATFLTGETYAAKLMSGENAREGMLAFKEKRPPKWVPSKL
ncbi:enoyl-CoA hydratase [Histoplasma capsulatum G186AR]|uniref:Enoyl-CoA hydratase n=1 Tax=Ajellomyces capsulatus (strain G186AR / H82 / ATCC MYA-2454 / RMSCC 2432) TaxID=447093 RepID=C0NN50_AJECG|nr:enoyl-CoA hydratase [Histoplasma capsulatum G186AR]EEH07298.1 enoyl-CoA hydratase [Histoplasma capsulatum G186AR]